MRGRVASLLSTAAVAADMAVAPQLRPSYEVPIDSGDTSGWYLRGDIGFSNQSIGKIGIDRPGSMPA